MSNEPSHPGLRVHLSGQESKPLAMIAMVRRALQKAGHHGAATRFTDEALGASPAQVIEIAGRYVRVE